MFLDALERGETGGRFSAEGDKPDVTATPVPRFDLLQLEADDSMSVQFSRGCPFNCEFCDIIVLYGRKPRTKTPEQLVAELQYLHDLGWRRSTLLVDDNFIGNKRNTRTRFWRYLVGMARNNPAYSNSSYRCWPTTSTSSSTARSFSRKSASSWNHCPQKNPQQPKNSSRPDPQSCT